MKRNYLKERWGRSFVFIIALFLLIVLGLIQPHASEKVVKYTDFNNLPKAKSNYITLSTNDRLPYVLSSLENLREKLQQDSKSNNPAFSPQFYPPLFPEKLGMQKVGLHLQKVNTNKQALWNKLKRQPGNLKSKQMQFMREIHKLKRSKGNISKGSIIQTNGETGSIKGTITCTGCGGEICVTACGDVPGPDAPILGETYIPSPGGPYEITNLPLGTEIWVSAWWDKPGSAPFPDCGDYTGFYEGNPISLTVDIPYPDGIDITLEEISITGQIICPCCSEGQIQVSAWDGEVGQSDIIGLKYIDSPGYYIMTNLPHDTDIWIAAWWDKEQEWIGPPDFYDYYGEYEGNYINLTEEEPCLAGIHISLKGDSGSISGEIICSGCGEGEIWVTASGDVPGPNSPILGETYIPSPGGPYEITNLPLDTEIWVIAWWDKEQEWNPPLDCGDYVGSYERNPIIITESDKNLKNKNIILNEIICGSISGKVTVETTGEGLENVNVCVLYDPINFYRLCRKTNDSGEYTIPNLAPGKYPVCVFNRDFTEYPRWEIYDDAPTFSSNNVTLVEVRPGEENPGIDFSIPEVADISGSVTVDEDVDVTILALDPLYSSDFLFFGYGGTVINGSGNYTITGLHPDGCYMMLARREDNGYAELYDNVISPFATDLVCQPGVDIDFNFQDPGCIEGYITDADDKTPIPNISVGVYDSETGELEITGISDDSGNYTIMDYRQEVYVLPPKTYEVKTFSSGTDCLSQTKEIELSEGKCEIVDFQLTKSDEPIPDISVTVGEGSGAVGKTVTIPITVDNLQNQYPTFVVVILFDTTKLELSGFCEGDINALLYHQPVWMLNAHPLWLSSLKSAFWFLVYPSLTTGTTPESATIANLEFRIIDGNPGDEIELALFVDPPCDTTNGKITILPPQPPPWFMAYDEMWGAKKDEKLSLLRTFRDRVLADSEVGREYTFMLYNNSLEILLLLFQNPSLIEETRDVIDEILPGIHPLLNGGEMSFSKEHLADLELLLSSFETKASPKLKTAIRKVKKDLKERNAFEQLGIKIVE